MKSIYVLFICFAFFSIQESFANSDDWFAEVQSLQGAGTLDGKSLSRGGKISTEGVIITSSASSVQIAFRNKDGVLKIAANSSLRIIRPKPEGKDAYQLSQGSCRWKVKQLASGHKWIRVKTPVSTMGVRGTDFLATFNPMLGESEIVVFDGKVEFGAAHSPKDKKIVSKGQWGGIGGRFGKKVSNILTLNEDILTVLRKPVEITQ